MGKMKGEEMINKKAICLAIYLFIAAISLGGCETAKGVALGIGTTADGVAKDVCSTAGFFQGLDSWIRKNLW